MPDIEKQVDGLYALPLDEFTPARDALAREVREGGDREAATRVKKLRKPSLAAWAVNQLAHGERKQVRALLRDGEKLRRAHDAVLSGGGRARLDRASQAEREAVDGLVDRAQRVLGDRASEATLDRVRDTLHAAAGDEELRFELERGRVVRERKPAVFGSLAADAPGTPEAKKAKPARDAQRERLKAARQAARDLRTAQRDAEKRTRDAERRLAAAERTLSNAERDVKRGRDEVKQARGVAEAAARDAQAAEEEVARLA